MQEIKELSDNPPKNIRISIGKNFRNWIVHITGAPNTIYANETYRLNFKFPKDYPSKPPIVYFLKPCPKHVHVYSNGDICLSLLGKDWRPSMTAETLCVSILSMLSSAKEKRLPPDNAVHADLSPGKQDNKWMYHDDRC